MSSLKYQQFSVVEKLPEKLELGGAIEANSVITSRTTREVLPSTGTSFTYSGTNIIEFVLSDSGYADFQTMALTWNQKVASATNALTCIENAYALIRRSELLVNGQVVEVLDNVGQVVGQTIACTASQDYYNNVLSRSGFWLDNNSMRLVGADGVCQTFPQKAQVISAQTTSTSAPGVADKPGMNVWLDLQPLIKLFSMQQFFPMRNISNLTLRFYLATPAECLVNVSNFVNSPAVGAGGATVADPTAIYTLSNVKLNYDSVQLTPSFTQSYDAFIASSMADPQGGLAFMFDSLTSQRSLVGAGSEVDILLSKACRYLCSVFGGLYQTSDLTNTRRVKTERHKIASLSGAVINIGGNLYPVPRPLNRAQVFAESDKAWNRNYDVLGSSLQNQTNTVGFAVYTGTAPSVPAAVQGNFDDADPVITDAVIDGTPAAGSYLGAGAFPDIAYGFLNKGVWAVNTETMIGANNTISGISLTGGAPAIVKLYFENPAPSGSVALSAIMSLHYKKIIKIRGDNNLEVIE
jgi:hypothetical protein